VWESTNKAVVAEFFPASRDRDAGFAAIYFSSGLAGALGFLCYRWAGARRARAQDRVTV